MTTIARAAPASSEEVLDELRPWLSDNWDPDLSVAEWWERLGLAGWAAPSLPTNAYGRGLSRGDSVRVLAAIGAFGALGPPAGLGLLLAAPTIAEHGTQDQIDTYGRDIVTGRRAWCQLFSEPGAGSDLAGLTSRAVPDGDEWVVNGQKVWTSLGKMADVGMLLARTDPDAPKHQGITWFALDMHQHGVEVRPLKEMTGHAMFNEVFMSDARVPNAAIIGEQNKGWAVANATLAHERAGLGAGGSGGGSLGSARPGTVAGQLDARAGDFVSASKVQRAKSAAGEKAESSKDKGKRPSSAALLIGLAKGNGTITDPNVRQRLVELHTLGEIARYNNDRLKGERSAGRDVPGMGNIAKLSMSEIMRLSRDLGLQIVGPQGMLHAYDDDARKVLDEATSNPFLGAVTGGALWAQGPPIYGGTDQIQRNIIGERVLGLPKEPRNDTTVPFSTLPKNV